jgi:hypothetical protein
MGEIKVFLSYAKPDQAYAQRLASGLAKEGYQVWDARNELLHGDNWSLRIGEALQQSDAMVVLLSPDAVKSEWIRREVEYALGSANYAGRLIPIVVRPTKEIPWILRKLKLVISTRNLARDTKHIADLLRRAEATPR